MMAVQSTRDQTRNGGSAKRVHKGRTVVLAVLALVVVSAVVVLLLPTGTTEQFDAGAYDFAPDTVLVLDGVPVVAQQTDHTCWAASLIMETSFLGADMSEEEVIDRLGLQSRTSGLLPNAFLTQANNLLTPLGYSVSLLNPDSEAGILNIVTGSLRDGLPVIIYFTSVDDWHRPSFGTHYSVVYGINMMDETVNVSNAYGYDEVMPFAELFDSLSYRNYEAEPFPHLLGRKVGYIKSNNLFVLTQIG